jgi:hypothetical protein
MQQLQQLCDELKGDKQYELFVEFRLGEGWYAFADEARYIGDKEKFLGANFEEAKKGLTRFLTGV